MPDLYEEFAGLACVGGGLTTSATFAQQLAEPSEELRPVLNREGWEGVGEADCFENLGFIMLQFHVRAEGREDL